MKKAILICGRICCGKSTYTEKLKSQRNAVVLSCDELMLSTLGEYLGDKHDEISAKARAYLLKKSTEILDAGVDVILDWGFWTEEGRVEAEEYFTTRGYETEWHYIKISEERWQSFIGKRNAEAPEGTYAIDENLKNKCLSMFTEPDPETMDVIIDNG